MSSASEQPITGSDAIYMGRPYWLPPIGRGNGLDARFWSQIAQVPQAMTGPLLSNLRAGGIPGWVSAVHPFGEPHPDDPELPYDVWIATSNFDSGEEVVMRYLNSVGDATRSSLERSPQSSELTLGSSPRRHRRLGHRTRRHLF
ncbi:MAG TPA: hypothetical protein VN133_05005 [Humibacter sp.]|jgi:hypothetical protein|nr:hypothetical protein [Humibacter sp.]